MEIDMTIKDPLHVAQNHIAQGLMNALAVFFDFPDAVVVQPLHYQVETMKQVNTKTWQEDKLAVLNTSVGLWTRTEDDKDSKKVGEIILRLMMDEWKVFIADLPAKEVISPADVLDPIWMTKDRAKLAKLRGDLMQYQIELSEEHPALSPEQIDRNKDVVADLQKMIDESESKEPPLEPMVFCRTVIEALSDDARKEFFDGYCFECKETHGRCECEPISKPGDGE